MSAIALDVLMRALGSLESRRRKLAAAFRSSEPFRHLVADDVFPHEFIVGILEESPAPDAPTWSRSATSGIQITLRSDWRTGRESSSPTPGGLNQVNLHSNETSQSAAHGSNATTHWARWHRDQTRELP